MKKNNILIIFITLLVTITLFILQYHFDNKYTYDSPIGNNGIVDLSDGHKTNMLTYGWEVYIQQLVDPKDIDQVICDEIVYLGQYNDLSFKTGTYPHGIATYHLKVLLPSSPMNYVMEIPEIFSASQIYINDKLMWSAGDMINYSPHVQTGTIMFEAQQSIDITIQVRDESHYYSGLVYPFLFGHQQDVMNILNIRQLIRYFVCTLTLVVSLLTLSLAMIYHRKEFYLLSAFSLSSCLYLAYPIYHQLGLSLLSYRLEDFCYFMMIALIVQLHCTICHIPSSSQKLMRLFNLIFLVSSCILPLFFYQNNILMDLYSLSITAYKCIIFSWIITTSLFLFTSQDHLSQIWLINICIFTLSLFMNAFFPLFEPVISLWQIEIASLFIILSLAIVFIKKLLHQYYENIVLENHIRDMKKQYLFLRNNYIEIEKNIQEIHEMKHDMRHHLLTLQDYNQRQDYAALSLYLNNLTHYMNQPSFSHICDNHIFNAIMHTYLRIANENDIVINYNIHLPQQINIDDWKIGSILGNLLENAVDACLELEKEKRTIDILGHIKNNNLILSIKNPIHISLQQKNHRYLSTKHSGYGLGLQSVKNIISSLNGDIEIIDTPPLFEVNIIIWQINHHKEDV